MEFDFRIQLQTDPHRMPIESASVIWPERLSQPVTTARLQLPVQAFDSPEQLAFARNLSFQPWHSIPDHRPLGSQNRARKAIYYELSKLRQDHERRSAGRARRLRALPLYTVAEPGSAAR